METRGERQISAKGDTIEEEEDRGGGERNRYIRGREGIDLELFLFIVSRISGFKKNIIIVIITVWSHTTAIKNVFVLKIISIYYLINHAKYYWAKKKESMLWYLNEITFSYFLGLHSPPAPIVHVWIKIRIFKNIDFSKQTDWSKTIFLNIIIYSCSVKCKLCNGMFVLCIFKCVIINTLCVCRLSIDTLLAIVG